MTPVSRLPSPDSGLQRIGRATPLAQISIAYLTLPIAIWMIGWLAPLWVLLGLAVLLIGVVQLATSDQLARDDAAAALAPRQLLSLGVVVALLVALNGVGGFGPQTDDWLKHNAILRDLIDQPWPIAYKTAAGSVALVYYLAYYLPAAVVGKAFGWVAANLALYVWTVFGCALVVIWLVRLSRAPLWLCLVGFALFSGLDVAGALLRPAGSGLHGWTDWTANVRLEWWEGHWLFPGMQSLLAYVPQQALGGWLLTCLTLERWRSDATRVPYVLSCALALMWSPYVAIGLAALSLLVVVAEWRWRELLAQQLSIANLAGAALATLFAIYFAARFAAVQLSSIYVSPPAAFRRGAFDVGLHGMAWPLFLQHYVASVLLEFLLLAVLLALAHRAPAPRRLLYASTGVLLLLPLVHHGHFNDLVMRAAIPSLLVLLVLTLQALAHSHSRTIIIGLALLLAIGALNPLNLLRRNLAAVIERRELFQVPQVTSLFELQIQVKQDWPYLYQYICPLDSFFFRHLARSATAIDRDA